jgi:6-pyruvoyltetrahydropterin/6-carboxytetrahydropterin synthase
MRNPSNQYATVIRLRRDFTFEAAHLLPWYKGDCRHLHGHSYRLEVEIGGRVSTQEGQPDSNMVVDLQQLKRWVHKAIIDDYDHALLLSEVHSEEQMNWAKSFSGRILTFEGQPSCEQLVVDMAHRLRQILPANLVLMEVRLWETANSSASWHFGDQLQQALIP